MPNRPAVELLLRTDLFGRVLAVLAAEPGLAARLPPGSFLAELVADRSSGALLDFLLTLRRVGATVSSLLELAADSASGEGARERLTLGGVRSEEGALIWAADSAEEARARGRALASAPQAPGSPRLWAAGLRLFGSEPAADLEIDALRRELAAARAEVERLQEELAARAQNAQDLYLIRKATLVE